jgi:hypothetical protein
MVEIENLRSARWSLKQEYPEGVRKRDNNNSYVFSRLGALG